MSNEEIIIKACDKIKNELPTVDIDRIRGILDEVLYDYQILPAEHDGYTDQHA